MAKKIRRKSTFGSAHIDHFRPSLTDKAPKAINMILSFEDTLRLGQILGHLNGYDRSTTDGKRSAVNLCVYPEAQRVTVNESKIKMPLKKKAAK